jgi:hypothetical protein
MEIYLEERTEYFLHVCELMIELRCAMILISALEDCISQNPRVARKIVAISA